MDRANNDALLDVLSETAISHPEIERK